MANSKLLEIIRSFSPEEREEFSLFLKSPFFVRGGAEEMLLRFFSYLSDVHASPHKGLSDKAEVHSFVFPEKPYSERRLEKIFTRMSQLLEQFLVTKNYQREDNELQRSLDFLSVLREKKLFSLYEPQLQKIKKDLKETSYESTKNYKFQYEVVREEHEWRSIFNVFKGDLAINESISYLDFFYFSERIELANRLLLQEKIAALDTSNIIQFGVEPSDYYMQYEAQSPLLLIRRKIHELFLQNKPTKQEFESLFKLINLHEKRFPLESLHDLFAYLRNICTILINSANNDIATQEMYEVLHEIQKDNLSKGYFYYNGKLTQNAFLNIIKVALRVTDVQWAKYFLESHRHMILENDDTEELIKFCFALCYFTEKKYEASLSYISFSANYPLLHLETRRLELKNYFELQSELLLYKIDAFRKFLERTAPKTISAIERERNLTFVKLLLQLVLSKPTDTQRSTRLIKRIEEKKMLAESSWLLEKARELAQADKIDYF